AIGYGFKRTSHSEELRRHAYYNIGCNVCHLICSGRGKAAQAKLAQRCDGVSYNGVKSEVLMDRDLMNLALMIFAYCVGKYLLS
ncbi:hypothetical protein QLZ19_21670, partial [Cronobacter sakazakii]|nr:hypothetical protein [Cronobacter sakazakii]